MSSIPFTKSKKSKQGSSLPGFSLRWQTEHLPDPQVLFGLGTQTSGKSLRFSRLGTVLVSARPYINNSQQSREASCVDSFKYCFLFR